MISGFLGISLMFIFFLEIIIGRSYRILNLYAQRKEQGLRTTRAKLFLHHFLK